MFFDAEQLWKEGKYEEARAKKPEAIEAKRKAKIAYEREKNEQVNEIVICPRWDGEMWREWLICWALCLKCCKYVSVLV